MNQTSLFSQPSFEQVTVVASDYSPINFVEEWQPAPGFENSHQISNLGRVKSLSRPVRCFNHGKEKFRITKEKILRSHFTKTGYQIIQLCKGGKHQSVHRLVAKAFIPNPENKPCVNHIDGNPANNVVANLEWCTYSENEKHSYKSLGKKFNSKGLRHYDKSWEEPPIIHNGFKIIGASRKKIFSRLCLGLTVKELSGEVPKHTIYVFLSELRRAGVNLREELIPNGKFSPQKKYFLG